MANSDGSGTYKMHWWYLFRSIIPWLIAIAALLILGKIAALNPLFNDIYQRMSFFAALFALAGVALTFLLSFVQWSFTTLKITDDLLIYEKGIIQRTLAKVPLHEISAVDLRQSIFERLLGAGDLLVDMRGVSILRINMLADPEEVQDRIAHGRGQAKL